MTFKFRENKMKRKILSGEDYSWLLMDVMSVEVVEIIGALGFDSIMIEGEHAALNEDRVLDLVRAAERYDITPCIRLGEINPAQISRLLDMGIQGVRYTHVRTADDVHALVRAAKYPPVGDRGFGRFSRANGFGLTDEGEAMRRANDELFLTVSIEDEEGARNVTEICGVPGIDQVSIGPSDLSASMGLAGQYDHPRFKELYWSTKEAIQASAYGRKEGRRIGGSANLLIAECMQEVLQGTRRMKSASGLNEQVSRPPS